MSAKTDQVQWILSLGYVVLIVLGIVNQSLFYGHFGINILEYSDILDVLVNPIAELTSNLGYFILTILGVILLLIIPPKMEEGKDNWWIRNITFKGVPAGGRRKAMFNFLLIFCLSFHLGVFVGAGLVGGYKLKEKVQEGSLTYKDKVKFHQSEKELELHLLGKNSSYLFYILKGEKEVRITPITGNVDYIKVNP